MEPLAHERRAGVREVLALAWPILVAMLSYTAMSAADAVFLGRLGTAPLAALGIAATTLHLATALGSGLLRGVRAVSSQGTGAGEPEQVRRAGWQALWLSLLLGGTVAAASPAGPMLFGWMGAEPEVMAHATGYFGVLSLAAPLGLLIIGLGGWLQGRGDTRTPMVATLLANGINVALDPVLIFGLGPVPRMEASGAALATALAQGAACVLLLVRARERLGGCVGVDLTSLRRIARFGLPMGVQRFLEVASWTVFVGVLARLGSAELAAHVLVIRVVMISFLPGFAIAEAGSVLVGQAVGAGRRALAREAWWAATRLAVSVMAAFAVVFVLVPDPILAAFGAAPEVAAIARRLLVVAAAFQVFDAVATVNLTALDGAGDTRFTMALTVVCAWLVKLPLGVLLAVPLGLGAEGAWLGLTAEIVVVAGVSLARIRGRRWLTVSGPVLRPVAA